MDYIGKTAIVALGSGALIFAAVPLIPASAAPVAPRPVMPAWVHWQRAPQRAARDACGTWHHGRTVPGIEVWGGNGDTGAMVCASGRIAPS